MTTIPFHKHSLVRLSTFALSATLLTACVAAPSGTQGGKDDHAHEPESQAIALNFKAMVGSSPLVTSPSTPTGNDQTYSGVGQDSKTIRPLDFRFYVHDVELLNSEGATVSVTLDANDWQYKNLALVDLDAGATPEQHAAVTGTAPKGTYTGVRFTLGVPHALNHTDHTAGQAPHPILSAENHAAGMTWVWLSGRIYARFDFNVLQADETEKKFVFHLGGTGATNPTKQEGSYTGFDPSQTVMESPNRPVITLSDFDPTKDVVAADLKTLFANVNVESGGNYMPAPMTAQANNPDPKILLKNLGLSGGADQKLFRKL